MVVIQTTFTPNISKTAFWIAGKFNKIRDDDTDDDVPTGKFNKIRDDILMSC